MNDFNRVDAPFVVFEGIDGSGKDLLCHSVVEDFSKSDLGSRGLGPFWKTEEPYLEDITGKKLREALSSKDFDKDLILDLFLQNRFVHTHAILQKLKKNITVFSVRYDLSTYAYQSISESISEKSIEDFFDQLYKRHCYPSLNCQSSSDKAKSLVPTVTIFCDVKVDVAMKRLEKRREDSKKKLEYFEEVEKLKLISENYQKASDYLKKKDDRSIIKIDANENQDVVFEKTKNALKELKIF